jgi:hypothetical protein
LPRLKESGNKTGMGFAVSLGGAARSRNFRRMLSLGNISDMNDIELKMTHVAKRELAYTGANAFSRI